MPTPPAAGRIRLIVNADDFGLAVPINEGIIQAHREGIVTATSLMAVGQAFAHAVECLREIPSLDAGIHLTLVAERPLLPCPAPLVRPDGRFPAGAGTFLRHWLQGRIRPKDVEAEWSAQIEHLLAHDIRPTHLDSHQHLHCLPGLAEISLRLARRYGIGYVRVPIEGPWRGEWRTPQGLRRLLGASALGASWLVARLSGAGKPANQPPHFLGFYDGGRLDAVRLRRLLSGLRAGRVYELMCHPGLKPDAPDICGWGYGHEEELQTLTAPSIQSEIAARGIRLCSFANLARDTS